jgi:hypothetical protein
LTKRWVRNDCVKNFGLRGACDGAHGAFDNFDSILQIIEVYIFAPALNHAVLQFQAKKMASRKPLGEN